MKKILVALCATASLFAGLSAASADPKTESKDLHIHAKLIDGCTFDWTGMGDTIDFKEIANLKQPMSEASTFDLTCSGGVTNVSIGLNNGQASGASTSSDRALTVSSGSDTLTYQVYQGAQGTRNIWDNDNPYTFTMTEGDNEGGSFLNQPFWVELNAQPTNGKDRGDYYDTLQATLTYTPAAS